MPAVSQQQQKLFGLALAVKRGEVDRSEASDEVLNIVDSMTEKEIEDFASTSHSGLPKTVEQKLREMVRGMMKETIMSEGLFQNIMKGVKNGSGPFTLVVIKDNKVVKQVTVNTPQAVPASYTTLEKQYPNSRIRIEDATGKMVFGESIEEAIPVGFEMGDFVHFKSANKTGMVKKISGDKITIMTMKGDYTGDIKDIKILYQDNLNEKLDNTQLALLKYAYKDIKRINPSEPAYGRLVKHLDTLSKSELQQLADAGINFISLLAKNRLMRSESVNEGWWDQRRNNAYRKNPGLVGDKFAEVADEEDLHTMIELKTKNRDYADLIKANIRSMDALYKKYKISSSKGIEK